jgi:hypothetical protein
MQRTTGNDAGVEGMDLATRRRAGARGKAEDGAFSFGRERMALYCR